MAPNVRGAAWMMGSVLSFTVMTTLIKYLGADYSAALQTFYRQLAGFVVLTPLIARDWRGAYRTHRPGVIFFRASAGTIGMILSFYAFQVLPLADANALSFTRTLWLVPLAFFVLREKVGAARLAAALAGFAGVLLMLQSIAGEGHVPLGWAHAAALTSAFLFALTITGMKTLTRDHSPLTILVWSASLGLIFSIPPALFVWRWPTPLDLGLLCAMGVMGTITQACYIKGMQIGDAAAMAPIDYTRLVFTALAGYLLFSEVPGLMTLAGAAIVVASTLIITWREHRIARRNPQPPLS